jgi:DNA-binding response OmpR family regulator
MSERDISSPEAAILIIEDDDVTATELQTGLLGAGYVVRRAGSADEAMGALKSTRPDLILMNLMLPDTDGLILCATLRATLPTPIILLSERAGEVDRALARESGALDLLTTPVDLTELLARVRAIVASGVRGRTRGQGSDEGSGVRGQGSGVRGRESAA